MRIISTLALSMLLLFGTPLYGQLSTNGLITHNAARSLGMQRAWYMQVPMDPYSNRILDVYLHVNAAEASWSYEVTQGGERVRVFSDKDLDSFGRPVGREQAKKDANAFRLDLGGDTDLIPRSVPKIYLSILSDRGDVTLVNGETGQVYWTTHVGNPRHPSVGVCTNDEYTVVVTGVRLFVLRNTDGGIVQERITQSLPGAGPVMVNKNIFVPSIQDRVEYYNLDQFTWTPGVFGSSGRVVTQPTIGGQSIAWPTDRGNIYVAGTGRPKMWYYVDTIGKVIAPIAYQQPGQYVANCLDGFVYCFNERDGRSIWRQSIGESLVREPIIIKDRVYVISQNKTCYCLSMKTGDVQWSYPDVTQIVSASGERLYALDRLGNLLVLNLKNGGHYTSLAAGKIDFVMLNALTDRIYMGTRRGLIQCIHETHREFPLLHVDEVATTDDADEGDNNVDPKNLPDPMRAQPEAPPKTTPFARTQKK